MTGDLWVRHMLRLCLSVLLVFLLLCSFVFVLLCLFDVFVRLRLLLLFVLFVLFVTLVRGGVRFPGEVDELVLPRLRRTVVLRRVGLSVW